jgi:hypothetical protein
MGLRRRLRASASAVAPQARVERRLHDLAVDPAAVEPGDSALLSARHVPLVALRRCFIDGVAMWSS